MQNALHEPQSILLLGGTSEIGLAIVDELLAGATRTVVLACRRPEEAPTARFDRPGLDVVVEPFDAADTASHEAFVERVFDRVGDLDMVVMAFGALGTQAEFDDDPAAAVDVVHVNYTGAVSVGLQLARRLRRQGHGHLVVVSSVAGERARSANYVYGSSKAALDAFAQGLADAGRADGLGVTVVRPGFVHTRMTRGLRSAPFATTPRVVGERTAAAVRDGRHTVWVPGILRYVFMILRHVPRPIFRRLPLG